MTFLLDVNVLVALAWPNHVHHVAARSWFTGHAGSGWATCPVSESGFVRVSANPAVPHVVTPIEAMMLLERMRALAGHRFWNDDISVVASPHVDRDRVVSHRQVTDAHLVALARANGGCVATFDRGLRRLLARGQGDPSILLIGPTG